MEIDAIMLPTSLLMMSANAAVANARRTATFILLCSVLVSRTARGKQHGNAHGLHVGNNAKPRCGPKPFE